MKVRTSETSPGIKGYPQVKMIIRKLIFPFYFISCLCILLTSCQKSELTDPVASSNSALNSAQLLLRPMNQSSIKELFLKSAINIDVKVGNITLPLFKGQHNGQTVWYIVTESSDKDMAERLGVNFSPKLANALGTAAVQHGRLLSAQTGNPISSLSGISFRNVILDFEGDVDFSRQRISVPGPDGFPPSQFQAGAIGDAKYSPLVSIGNGIVLNASHVANATGLHDAIMSIDYNKRQVTLDQFNGFYNGKKILYLHQESSSELVAAIEGSTWAPNLDAAPGIGSNDPKTSAREAIIPVVNGERGVNNPDRQGLQSALFGEGDPLNIIQEEPGDKEYSPVWDLHTVVWTDAAIKAGKRKLLTDADKAADNFKKGLLISGTPNSGVKNKSLEGLVALGAISMCPVSALLQDAGDK